LNGGLNGEKSGERKKEKFGKKKESVKFNEN